jgi:hypothetical protein
MAAAFVDAAGVRALDGAHQALQARSPLILRTPHIPVP